MMVIGHFPFITFHLTAVPLTWSRYHSAVVCGLSVLVATLKSLMLTLSHTLSRCGTDFKPSWNGNW